MQDDFESAPRLLPREPAGPPRWPWAAALGLAVAGGLAWYFFFRAQAPAPPPPSPAPVAEATPAPSAAVALPSLDQSDGWLRERAARLSAHPALARWLQAEHLARRLTAALAALADGRSPREQLSFLAPATRFEAVERGGRWYVSQQAYARYDEFADAVGSVDARAAAELYGLAKPLLEAAYDEIALPGATLDGAVRDAVAKLLSTPAPADDPELVEGEGLIYVYADPALEGLTAAQKHLVRMGPRNTRLIQAKLREFAVAAGLS